MSLVDERSVDTGEVCKGTLETTMSTNSDTALLMFKLGPVQPFIESARTLRDLWTGSYLLSWLTAHAMVPLIQSNATFITPHVTATNPLLRIVLNETTGDEAATLSCLPHTFAALVPVLHAESLRQACIEKCEREWNKIAVAVKHAIQPTMSAAFAPWADNWDAQVGSYFEFRCVTLPLSEATTAVLDELRVAEDDSQSTPEDKLWSRQWNLLGALMDVARSVRHVPEYAPRADGGRFPVKCSLLGSFEQMGPANLDASKAFWAKLTKLKADKTNAPGWDGFHGTRLQASDKLCAISLVKRFAWPAYFAKTPDPKLPARLGVHVHQLRFTDTATMAARNWLNDGEILDPHQVRADYKRWSGQWLHWSESKNDDDDDCPDEVWHTILSKRRSDKQGKPPTYYALLHMDGDSMGKFFQGDEGKTFGDGMARFKEITKRLTSFTQQVRDLVLAHSGELIYAGGDDVFAILPTETAVACARALHVAFREDNCLKPDASLSGGIAVVHYKEDLRFALQQVREAEKKAKRISKPHGKSDVKNALALTVCRRSGEHTTVVLGWAQTELLTKLVNDFIDEVSDRWAYKLRTELPTLRFLPLHAARAETLRLVGRTEKATEEFKETIGALFDSYQSELKDPKRNWPDGDILEGFVTLCQSASFLARGRD